MENLWKSMDIYETGKNTQFNNLKTSQIYVSGVSNASAVFHWLWSFDVAEITAESYTLEDLEAGSWQQKVH